MSLYNVIWKRLLRIQKEIPSLQDRPDFEKWRFLIARFCYLDFKAHA